MGKRKATPGEQQALRAFPGMAPGEPRPPTPGSRLAITHGCICPRMDNHNGRGIGTPKAPAFYIVEGCPVHCPDPRAPGAPGEGDGT